MGPDQPFYGLQAIGLDGQTPPLASVEEMAAQYAREITAAEPSGPYFLGGHSFGAAIAFEIAQQLLRAGRSVGLLAVFDASAPHTMQPSTQVARDDADWLAEVGAIIGELSGRGFSMSAAELRSLDADEKLAAFRSSLIGSGWLPPETTLTQVRAFVEVYKAHIGLEYRPRNPIPAPILLIKAQGPLEPNGIHPALDQALGTRLGVERFGVRSG